MRRTRAAVLWGVTAAVTYLVLSRLALAWRGDLAPSPLWLATAGATAVTLVAPRRLAVWAVLGSAVGGIASGLWVFDDTFRRMVSPVAANTLEVVIVVVLAHRWLPAGPSIRRTRDALIVMAIVLLATAASATVAIADTASVVIGERAESWGRWMLGDAVGQLLLLPVVLTRRARLITPATAHRFEIVGSCVGLLAITVVACVVEWPLIYIVAPLVLWLAIRFGPRLTAPLAPVLAVGVTIATGRGSGPFAALDEAVAQAQLFTLVLGLSALVGGAHALRAWGDHQRLAAVLTSLPDIVFVRDESGDVLDSWVPELLVHEAAAIAPGSFRSLPIVDGPMPESTVPAMVVTPSGAAFERRTAQLDTGRTIELYRDVTDEHEAMKLVRLRDEAIDEARASEQSRIASEIHDSPLQLIISARMRLEAVAGTLTSPADAELVTGIVALLRQASSELRGQIVALMPQALDGDQLVPALEHQARMVLGDGVDVVAHADAPVGPSPDVAKVLYLAGREAIANVAKHARAGRVTITLDRTDRDVVLTIADDGVGLVRPGRGVGLSLMGERVDAVGGRIEIRGDGGGTTLTVIVPDDSESRS